MGKHDREAVEGVASGKGKASSFSQLVAQTLLDPTDTGDFPEGVRIHCGTKSKVKQIRRVALDALNDETPVTISVGLAPPGDQVVIKNTIGEIVGPRNSCVHVRD